MENQRQDENNKKSSSRAKSVLFPAEQDEIDQAKDAGSFASLPVARAGGLERLVDTAKDYARHATDENTNAAYKADWAHFGSWCRRRGVEPLPPSPELLGLYIANCASPDNGGPVLSVATIERRLSGLSWHYQQRGFTIDRKDRHISTV